MDLVLLLIVNLAVTIYLFGILRHHGTTARRTRAVLLAQTWTFLLFKILLLFSAAFSRFTESLLPSWFSPVIALPLGLGLSFCVALASYFRTGRWRNSWYLLSVFALFPRYGLFLAGFFGFLVPLILAGAPGRSRDIDVIVRTRVIVLGTAPSLFFLLLFAFLEQKTALSLALPTLALSAFELFFLAGLHLRSDPEHEFTYSEVRVFVRRGLFLVVLFSAVPPFLPIPYFLTLARIALSGVSLLTVFLLILLLNHFDSRSMRMFLVLLLASFLAGSVNQVFGPVFANPTIIPTLRLFSRGTLVLASLFILRQYLRWGFPVIQVMVMFVVAVASATFVLLVLFLLQPAPFLPFPRFSSMATTAILLLDSIVFLSLPPVLFNYGLGTMKVTWALFSFGILLEGYPDFLPAITPPSLHYVVSFAGTSLVALAFGCLWKYSDVLIRGVTKTLVQMEER